ASMGVLKTADSGDDQSAPGSAGGSGDTETQPKPVAAGKKPATGGQKKTAGIKPRPGVADSGKNDETAKRNGTSAPNPKSPAPYKNGHANGHTNGHTNGNANGSAPGTDISTALLARAGIMPKDAGPNTARSEQFADFQSDAPACDNCGSITVRA